MQSGMTCAHTQTHMGMCVYYEQHGLGDMINVVLHSAWLGLHSSCMTAAAAAVGAQQGPTRQQGRWTHSAELSVCASCRRATDLAAAVIHFEDKPLVLQGVQGGGGGRQRGREGVRSSGSRAQQTPLAPQGGWSGTYEVMDPTTVRQQGQPALHAHNTPQKHSAGTTHTTTHT